MRHYFYDIFIEQGIAESSAKYLNMLILLIALLVLAFIIDFVTTRFLRRISEGIAKRTKTNFDDILIKNKLPRNVAHIIPLIIIIKFVPLVFSDFPDAEVIIDETFKVIAIILTIRIIKLYELLKASFTL